MKGSKPMIGTEPAHPAIGSHEVKARLRTKPMIDADRPAKVPEISAAAHADVLTGVDELARGRISK
jgi:hypothetical protein